MTNREYLINLLMYHISCPYQDGDPRCRCNSIIVGDSIPEELCAECKYEWLDSEVEE